MDCFFKGVQWVFGIAVYPLYLCGDGNQFFFLAQAVKTLPVGTSYAIWIGIGVVGAMVVCLVWYGEPLSFLRVFFTVLILISIVGLKLFSH